MKETPTKATTVRCFTGALALSVITLASITFAPRPSLAECPETGCNKAPPLLFELEQPTVYPVSSNQKHLCFPDMPAQVSLATTGAYTYTPDANDDELGSAPL